MDATVIGRVAVKVVPDTRNFRKETERALGIAEKSIDPVEIEFEAQVSDAVREVDRAVKTAERQAKAINLKVRLDNQNEIKAGMKRIERELEMLTKPTEIPVDLNRDDLIAARELLAEELAKVAHLDLKVNYDDNSSVRRALSAIETELSKLEEVDLTVKLDKESLTREAEILKSNLADALREQEFVQAVRMKVELENDNAAFRASQARIAAEVQSVIGSVDVNLDIDAEAKTKFDREVRDLASKLDALRLELKPDLPDREKHRIEEEIDRLEGEFAIKVSEVSLRSAQARLAVLARTRVIDLKPEVDSAATLKASSTLAALTGIRASFEIGQEFNDFLSNLDRAAPSIARNTLAITGLTSSVLTATSNLFSLGGSIASISGAAYALPGIFGGMALGLGATAAVLKDFNDQVPGVAGKFHDLQDSMSERFYDKAAAPFRSFIDTIFPQFADGMEVTSTALGEFFANLATSGEGVLNGQLDSMFADLGDSIVIAGDHTDSFIGIIEKLGSVGAGNLPRLAEYFGGLADKFNNFLAAKGPDGLQSYIDRGVDALQDFGGVIAATGSIFSSLSDAAEKAGGSTLATLRKTMEGAAEIAKGATFQNALVSVLRAAREGLGNVADRAGDDFKGFALRVSSILTDILPSAGRTIGNLFEGVFQALDSDRVQSSIKGLFDAFERSSEKIAPALDGLVQHLAGVVDIAGVLVETVTGVLVPVIEKLGPKFDEVVQDLLPLIEGLGELASGASDLVSGALSILPSGLIVAAGALGVAYLAAKKIRTSLAEIAATARVAASDMIYFGNSTAANLGRVATGMTKVKNAKADIAKAAGAVGLLALASSGAAESMGLQNTATDAMIGFVAGGVFGAAIGAFIGGYQDYKSSVKNAKRAQEDFNKAIADLKFDASPIQGFTSAFDGLHESSDAYFDSLPDNAWEQAFKSFTPSGFFTNIDYLFGNASEEADALTQSYVDSGIALDDLKLAGRDLATQFGIVPETFNKAKITTEQMDAALSAAAPAMDLLGLSVEDLIAAVKDGSIVQMYDDIAAATAKLDSPQARTDALGTSIKDLGNDAITASIGADALKKSLDALLDPSLNVEAATDEYHQALTELNKQLEKSKAGFAGYGKGALENRSITRDYVGTVKDLLVAQAQSGAGSGKIAAQILTARDAFIKEGVEAGRSATAMEARANAIGLTPNLVKTVFKAIGLDLTNQQVKSLTSKLDSFPKSVKTKILNNFPETEGAARRLANKLDLTAKDRKLLLSLVGDDKVRDGLKKTKKSADDLTGKPIKAEVGAKDTSDEVLTQAKVNLEKYGREIATATLKVQDNASAQIAKVLQALNNLDGKRATVITEHRTLYSSSGGKGGSDDKGPAGKRTAQSVSKTLEEQLTKSFSDALIQMQNRANNTFDALLRKFKEKAQKTKLKSMFADDLVALNELSKAHDRLMKQYDAAQRKLAGYRAELKAFKEGVVDTIVATADPTALGAVTFDGIVRGMQNAADQAKAFRKVIKALIKDGLNKTTLQQLLAAGPEAGLATAQAILNGGVGQINQIQGQIKDAANGVANAAGQDLFGNLIDNAEATVKGLLKKLVPLQKQIRKFAKDLMAALRDQLKAEAIKLGLGNIDQPNPGQGGHHNKTVAPRTARTTSAAALAEGGTRVVNKTLNYYAAPNKSLDSEGDLFDALHKAQGGWI